MNDIVEIFRFIGTAVSHALPFFLISIFLSVLVKALKLEGTIRRVFSNRVGVAIVLATAVGAFSPFCSCTIIPIIAGLLASGVPLAPVMSFWVASPTMDPEIFALTVGILGWPIAVVRLVATLLLSLGAGYVTLLLTRNRLLNYQASKKDVVKTAVPAHQPSANAIPIAFNSPTIALSAAPAAAPATSCSDGGCSIPLTVVPTTTRWQDQLINSVRTINWPTFGRDMARESWQIGRWLLVAFLLEALITLYVPQATIASLLGDANGLAVPLATIIGIPLYLTNITALPIISGLLAQGMQPGAAIAFLIAGPVTTIPAMTAVWGIVNRRIFVLYLAIGLVGAMILGLLANLIL
ncbi:MAG: hypothetical protein GY943_10715 [Chloroflexi bacterium]|nr:hypothetical protein [Chloroflexota bacterium]